MDAFCHLLYILPKRTEQYIFKNNMPYLLCAVKYFTVGMYQYVELQDPFISGIYGHITVDVERLQRDKEVHKLSHSTRILYKSSVDNFDLAMKSNCVAYIRVVREGFLYLLVESF